MVNLFNVWMQLSDEYHIIYIGPSRCCLMRAGLSDALLASLEAVQLVLVEVDEALSQECRTYGPVWPPGF